MRRLRRVAAALALCAAALAACSGDDAGAPGTTAAAPTTAGPTTTPPAPTTAPATTTAVSGSTDVLPTPDDSLGDYEPGPVRFRVVNLLAEPVDTYVRTTGLVRASLVAPGVGPGTTTDPVAPPVDGQFVVVKAGAGDATCVARCPHLLTVLSATPQEGPVRTVILHQDQDGQATTFDLWEDPTPARTDASNAMPPADPDHGLVVVTAAVLVGADFGLRLGIDGIAGCQEPVNTNVLVGGTQTPGFLLDGEHDLSLYANTDRGCTGPPVGGPFTVDVASGARAHLILLGSPGAMTAMVIAFVEPGD